MIALITILVTIIPSGASPSEFGVSEGDGILYTLLQSQQVQFAGLYQIQGLNGTLQIKVGKNFTVSPISLDIEQDAKLGDYILIAISTQDANIMTRSLFSQNFNFFLVMDWDIYRMQHPKTDNTTETADYQRTESSSLIDTSDEIGYTALDRTDFGDTSDPNHSWNSYKTISRYSKTDGVRNYFYFESRIIEINSIGSVYNVSTVLEYIRVGYSLPPLTTISTFKIEWNYFWLNGVVVLVTIQKYRLVRQ